MIKQESKNNKSKIVFLCYSLSSGGAERVICNLANKLCENNDISIYPLFDLGNSYYTDSKVKIDYKNISNNNSFNGKLKNALSIIRKIKKEKPDIIISFNPTICFIICFFRYFVKELKKTTLIISERNDPKNEYNNYIKKVAANKLYSKSDIIVFQNTGAMSFFNNKVQKKGIIIPNPINEKFLNVNTKDYKKRKYIVNVGRLAEQKNQKLLIKAFSNISNEFKDYKLVIYGTGNLLNELKKLANQLNIGDKVEFRGNVNNLNEILPTCEIFVLSSNYEGMPNALMEAMAIGLPCISTNCPCGGPKELIDNDINGILVEVNNEEQLTESLRKLLTDKNKRNQLGKNAKNIINLYNPEIIYDKWINLINER